MLCLIVDDEVDLCDLCVESFDMEDVKTIGCYSAEEAIKHLEDKSSQFTVIISDDHMPGLSGRELFSKIKDQISHIKFYLCTGDMDIDESSLIESGMAGVITKPYNIDELIEKIKVDSENEPKADS